MICIFEKPPLDEARDESIFVIETSPKRREKKSVTARPRQEFRHLSLSFAVLALVKTKKFSALYRLRKTCRRIFRHRSKIDNFTYVYTFSGLDLKINRKTRFYFIFSGDYGRGVRQKKNREFLDVNNCGIYMLLSVERFKNKFYPQNHNYFIS